jgi:hypothetical protein
MWWYVAIFIASLVISYVLIPKPQQNPPPGLNEVKAPTAEEGREIPVLFGTREIKGMNVVWYGDIRLIAVKSEAGKK